MSDIDLLLGPVVSNRHTEVFEWPEPTLSTGHLGLKCYRVLLPVWLWLECWLDGEMPKEDG